MIPRTLYMNGKVTHRAYYAQFVTPHIKRLVQMRLQSININLEQLAYLYAQDENLNNIPLRFQDGAATSLPVARAMREAGDYLTASGAVCIQKEAAVQLLENPT